MVADPNACAKASAVAVPAAHQQHSRHGTPGRLLSTTPRALHIHYRRRVRGAFGRTSLHVQPLSTSTMLFAHDGAGRGDATSQQRSTLHRDGRPSCNHRRWILRRERRVLPRIREGVRWAPLRIEHQPHSRARERRWCSRASCLVCTHARACLPHCT